MESILKNKIYLALITIVLFFFSIGVSYFIFQKIENIEKDNLLTQAKLVANSVDVNLLKQLTGTKNDIETDSYLKINKQLRKIRLSNKACKFLYILAKRDNGEYFFYTDSQIINTEDYAEPGLIYEDISQEYKDAITSDTSAIVGPIIDQWGRVITALTPIKDESNGMTIATLGMDTTVNDWNDKIIINSMLMLSLVIFSTVLIFALVLISQQNKILKTISNIDELTSLYNRRKLNEVLDREIVINKRSQIPIGIIIIDIDHFKSVNDNYGHTIGDQVLIKLANLLKTHIRESDFVARWGGEEFMVVCANININGLKTLAQKICDTVAEYDFSFCNLTVSCGVALLSDNDTADNLFKKADDALYKAKDAGRNCVKVANVT